MDHSILIAALLGGTGPLRRSKTPAPIEPLFGHEWQPIRPVDKILVAEQSMIWVVSGHVTFGTPLQPWLALDELF